MFFSMTFYTDKKGRGIWTVSPFFRTLMVCIVFLVCAAAFLPGRSFADGINPAALFMHIFFAFFSLLGAAYRDCCIFDPHTKTLTRKAGFAFFVKKYTAAFEEIGAVRLSAVMQGERTVELQCSLCTKDGSLLFDIEHCKKNRQAILTTRAENVCAIIGCPLQRIRT